MKLSDVQMYSRNKNIHIEDSKGTASILWKVLQRASRFLMHKEAKESRVVFSGRIVEYPLLFSYLEDDVETILDFGCVEDLLPIHLCSLGYRVTGLDFRPYPFSHPNFNFIQADILTWEPIEDGFDAVISVSTVEHVGLGGYEDPVGQDGDRIAVEKLFQACRPGGKVYLTVPAGKPCVKRNMRIYDSHTIQELLPNIDVLRFFAKPGRYESWREITSEEIDELVYDDYYATSPGQGIAFIAGTKD
jgi:SAM-dependent methyltransferase